MDLTSETGGVEQQQRSPQVISSPGDNSSFIVLLDSTDSPDRMVVTSQPEPSGFSQSQIAGLADGGAKLADPTTAEGAADCCNCCCPNDAFNDCCLCCAQANPNDFMECLACLCCCGGLLADANCADCCNNCSWFDYFPNNCRPTSKNLPVPITNDNNK